MIRLLVALWLLATPVWADGLSAPITVAPIGQSNAAVSYPPVVKASGGGTTPSYTFVTSATGFGNGNGVNFTIPSIGAGYAIVGIFVQNGQAVPLMAIGSSALTNGNYIGGGSQQGGFWGGTIVGGSSVTLSASIPGSSGLAISVFVWLAQNLTNNSFDNGNYLPSASHTMSATISSGDLLFGMVNSGNAVSWGSSTTAPTGSRGPDQFNVFSADWMTPTNGLFTVNCGLCGDSWGVVAAYH